MRLLGIFGMGLVIILMLIPASVLGQVDCKASRDEKTCLACNIYYEARGQSEQDLYAVARVTLNRMKHDKFPNTICEVVYQNRQFSWTHDGLSDRPKTGKYWDTSMEIAVKALKSHNPNSNGLLYFHRPDIMPYWAKHMEVVMRTNAHIYYRKSLEN